MVKTEHHKIQSETSKAISSPSTSSSSSSSLACKKKYRGVRMRSWGSWVSEIRTPNQKARIWLGSYSTAEAAARAYDAALLCLKGSSANLNFPITPSHYIPDTVLSPKSIQRVAAAAANSVADTMISNQNANNSNNTPNTTNQPIPSPPLTSYSSPSPSSSSILSSPSTSDQTDDDFSLIQSLESYNEPISSMLDSWYNFDNQMFKGVNIPTPNFNIAPVMDDFFEGDIRLWSFNE